MCKYWCKDHGYGCDTEGDWKTHLLTYPHKGARVTVLNKEGNPEDTILDA
jgi:hypothetical protein